MKRGHQQDYVCGSMFSCYRSERDVVSADKQAKLHKKGPKDSFLSRLQEDEHERGLYINAASLNSTASPQNDLVTPFISRINASIIIFYCRRYGSWIDEI